ncbi:MAG: phosphotransferase family protein, partial [Proteobacteria bacterium]|nr:phosphotransferase family protein [Pseudomonadota bacterium]
MTEAQRAALANWLAERAGADRAVIEEACKLSGGAIQENWLIKVTMDGGSLPGLSELVLRTDSPSRVVQ